MNTITIAGKRIGYGRPPFIIAEAGVNHNGKLALALRLVDAAAAAGADAVKFQAFKASQVVTQSGQQAAYQRRNMGKQQKQVEMLKRLEFKPSWYRAIRRRCRQHGIVFLSTPHGGFDSVDEVVREKIAAFKFGSGELTNSPVLRYAAKFKRPLIVATGMATLDEVRKAVEVIHRAGNHQLVLLHATTNYPCPPEEVNLAAMQTMMRRLPCPVGYSDHTIGVEVPYTAALLGACVIEKHMTLDQDMPGPDHRASTEPEEFKLMVDVIRRIPVISGSPIKRPNPSERRMLPTVRKSLVSTAPIRRGERFTAQNIGIKRPGTGLSPQLYDRVLHRTARRNIPADRLLTKSDYAD